jgi:SAM-dependent methyltransferase
MSVSTTDRPQIPVPPRDLMWRVGLPRTTPRLEAEYERRGMALRRAILDVLPDGWSFEGKRVLDFGCGAGRVLRHFLSEATVAEVSGCDIHGPSVQWLVANLSPPLRVFRNDAQPPLPLAAGGLDLVWALAVFTHLTDSWSAWLLELHRVLADDGLLLVTFIGEGATPETLSGPWREDAVGMNVVACGRDWDEGGPVVLHSPWWIRAHWGRAFDVLALQPSGFGAEPDRGPGGPGAVLMRKRPEALALTPADLEAWEPDEPRELESLRYNLRQVQTELAGLRSTRSWRLTAPVRRLHSRVKARTGGAAP